jgi:hypothetical protein
MSARDLAHRAFWTDHPLCQLYMQLHDVQQFSVRQLIRFAESLPQHVIDSLSDFDDRETC